MTDNSENSAAQYGRDESSPATHDGHGRLTRRTFIASTVAAAGLTRIEVPLLANEASDAQRHGAGSAKEWGELRRRIKGDVHTIHSAGFPAVRDEMVWNALKPDRSPDVIVRVKGDLDVVEAVHFARENGLKLAVRGGGHSWGGLALRRGGMTIDLSALSKSEINASARTAVIQPAISNRELARRLGEFGLAFPIGHCPTVKASGYLLNGGMSWNMSRWGPACLSVQAIEMVTADGKRIRADATENSDLFWAARGCGPGMFAVATRFYLKCYSLPKAITVSTYYFSLHDLKEAADEVAALGRK
jgi:FAD/FMN-containing dehydrogenase